MSWWPIRRSNQVSGDVSQMERQVTERDEDQGPSMMPALDVSENPWLNINRKTHNAMTSKDLGPQTPSRSFRRTRPGNEGWQVPDGALYGFADEDGTLKQVEGQTWRGGVSSSKGRFASSAAKRRSPNITRSIGGATPAGNIWVFQTVCALTLLIAGMYATRTDTTTASKIRMAYQEAFASDYEQVGLPVVERFLTNHHIHLPGLTSSTTSP